MPFINMDITSVFTVAVYFISFVFTFRRPCLDVCQKLGMGAYSCACVQMSVFMNNSPASGAIRKREFQSDERRGTVNSHSLRWQEGSNLQANYN